MPETPVNKTDRLITGKDNVWFARQSSCMQPKSEPLGVKSPTQDYLRPRILPSNPGHHARPDKFVHDIRHNRSFQTVSCHGLTGQSCSSTTSGMGKPVTVVDLFSGPGGLGEGFSPWSPSSGKPRYRIRLSIEKDPSAHATLLLRSFLRQFERGFPREYYAFLNGATPEPDWAQLYPTEWETAGNETLCLELGQEETLRFLDKRVRRLRADFGTDTLLIGGPPCQAYSLVGRARNAGKDVRKTDRDPRVFLYREYVRVLGMLRPAVFLLENVKGILSSRVRGRSIFGEMLRELQAADGQDSYCLFGLASSDHPSLPNITATLPDFSQFLVQAQEHGIPQVRDRVFIVGLRSDVRDRLPAAWRPLLQPATPVSVRDILDDIPRLRCGLSRNDSLEAWRRAVLEACDIVSRNKPQLHPEERRKFDDAVSLSRTTALNAHLQREAPGYAGLPKSCPADLRRWIGDDQLERLPNNHTRAHMPSDLARYLFCAAFAHACGRSPKTLDFPAALAPSHKNWWSGKFDDRFRVQLADRPSGTVTSHLAKDGHYYIHPDASQCRSLTVREAARLQTFPDNYFFKGTRSAQYVQVGNAVPPFLAHQIADCVGEVFECLDRSQGAKPAKTVRKRRPVAQALAVEAG